MPQRKPRTRKTELAAGAVPAEKLAAQFPKLDLPLQAPFPPMEAKLVDAIPDLGGWQYEPKWDGFRCLAFRGGDEVVLQSKAGQPLGRYFPELVEAVRALRPGKFVLDGEIVISLAGRLSFDDLLMRIHPAASRIRRLAQETPATLLAFDLLVDERGRDLTSLPLRERRQRLEDFFRALGTSKLVRLSPATTERAQAERWMAELSAAGFDGVVAKQLDASYESGERAMHKVKRIRTADCIVGGFRFASKGGVVGSLLLGLYGEDGLLHHVGFTSSFNNEQRQELKAILEPYRGGSGFTGRAPGGPSRWSTERTGEWERLEPKLVCEVRYDHFSGGRFRHGTKFMRWRPEKRVESCTMEQVEPRSGQGRIEDLFAAGPRT